MTTDAWPTSWLKGFLELAVFAIIAEGETYGYEITSRLEAHGFGAVKGGTLYPILGRLEEAGLVEAQWRAGDSGPGRKYYRLTADGEAELSGRVATWRAFSHNLTTLLKERS
ncbi:PadR family transcriptional regulator [Tessaracoccus massiliensis]|uniref:PadR family transcriptional regulator n=1 Tax=Tessaracoccus massiliensis TaxID=1522311 RepID=UPI00058F7635|nr:PadR family transcriptional regulator [Tessaracoccus massiliensis]